MRTNHINMDDFYTSYYDTYMVGNKQKQHTSEVVPGGSGSTADAVTADISESGKSKYMMFTEMNVNITAGKAYWGATGLFSVSSEAFAVESMNKWNVFDKYLSSVGYYEGKSEPEISNLRDTMENVLLRSSCGVNFATGKVEGYSFFSGGDPSKELYSYEAQLELESSAAALLYFSNKNLSGEQKEQFDYLIHKYYDYTSGIINGYQSAEERLYAAIANGKQVSDDELRAAGASNAQIAERKKNAYIGGIVHSEEEQEIYKKTLRSLFFNMTQSNQKSIMELVKETVAKYATKNSDDAELLEYVKNKSEAVFAHISSYWKQIMRLG